jgi:hypothetical protein
LTQQEASKRMRVYDFKEFSVDLEYNETYVAIHLPEVPSFTKSTYKKMQVYIEQLSEFLNTVGYQNLFAVANDITTEKLMEKLGFLFLGQHNEMRVYVYKELN